MRLKERLKRHRRDLMNAQISTKQHPSGALANKNNHVVLKPLSGGVGIVPPPLFKSETATRSLFTERSDVAQATHEARVSIRFPILEKGIYKGTCGIFFAGQTLRAKRTVGAWLQLEEPHQGSWIRMQNPMDAKHLWIVEKKRTVPSDCLFLLIVCNNMSYVILYQK